MKNKTLQKFLKNFIEALKYEKKFEHNNFEDDNKLDIPFIISSLYQSFQNSTSDYE